MERDDFFTNIHKAIRAGLFDLITAAGATDWNEPTDVDRVAATWQRMRALLEAHTHHEDEYILRILDDHDPSSTVAATADHRRLDPWLGEIGGWFDAIVSDPDPVRGLALYRELALFCSEYLTHIHGEETSVMNRMWELCTDEEIAATRAAFMADVEPPVLDTTLRLMLPSIEPDARTSLVAGLREHAPQPVVEGVLAIAREVLEPGEAARLAALTIGVMS